MGFVSVSSLLGGSVIGAARVAGVTVAVPAPAATVHVYQRGTTTPVNVYEDQHGGGSPAAQPLTTNSDGYVTDTSGNIVFVAQPQELDVAMSGGALTSPVTISVGTILSAADVGAVSATGEEPLPIWQATHPYTVGQQVAHQNQHYACVLNHTSASTWPGTGTYWSLLGQGGGGGSGVQTVMALDSTITVDNTDPHNPVLHIPAGTFDASGAAAAALAASLQKSTNLSDLTNAATARTNLGLGTAATHPSTDFDAAGTAANAVAAAVAGILPAQAPVSAVGSGLTHSGIGQTVGGVVVTAGMRILDVANGVSSGIWVAAAGAWTRPTDFATTTNAQGKLVESDAGALWLCIATGVVTIDTTSQSWIELDPAAIQAGTGLTKSGTTINLALTKALVTATGLTYTDVGADQSGAAAAAAAASLPLAGGTMTGAIAMGAHKINGLTNGSAAQDAAAFGQVPTILPGQSVLAPAFASTVTIAIPTVGDVEADVGTLTGPVTITISGTPAAGQRLTVCTAQDATGGRVITWDASKFQFGDEAPSSLDDTTASLIQYRQFVYNATRAKFCAVGLSRGF